MLVVWWLARRDLMSIAETQQTPTLDKIEELRTSVNELLTQLDIKLADIEEKAQLAVQFKPEPTKRQKETRDSKPLVVSTKPAVEERPTVVTDTVPDQPVTDTRYEQVFALANAGMKSDEIARLTGLGSAEVEMVISLRPL
jgi:hypothetical protein